MKHLKIYALLTLLALAFTLPACNKDDDKAEPTAAQIIIGQWDFTSATLGGVEKPVGDCEKRTFLKFNTDGSFILSSYGPNSDGDCVNTPTVGQYEMTASGERLVFYIEGVEEAVVRKIANLTSTELSIYFGENILHFMKHKE